MKKLSAKNKLKNFYGPDFKIVDDWIKNYVETSAERQLFDFLQIKPSKTRWEKYDQAKQRI